LFELERALSELHDELRAGRSAAALGPLRAVVALAGGPDTNRRG
jgi:hypothetical protein